MSSMTVGWIIFGCVFGGALLGMVLQRLLPKHHLGAESRDVVKLGMGLIATMSALVLGLLVASAKSSYDTKKDEVTQMASGVLLLDRMLAHYGPETSGCREVLRDSVAVEIRRIWPDDGSVAARSEPSTSAAEALYDRIQALSPGNDVQRSLKAEALTLAVSLAKTRWLLYSQGVSSIPTAFLVVLVCWLTLLLASFGLFAPSNTTVIATLLVCALSVSSAIFLVLEMDRPFTGLIQIPSEPLRTALAHLGG
jgi:hypothetical protein